MGQKQIKGAAGKTPKRKPGPKKGAAPYNPSESPPDAARDTAGRYLPGNDFWKARSSHGRKPIWPDAQDLRAACYEYFDWVRDNPLIELRPFAFQGEVTMASVPKMRAMTIAGLCIFLGISQFTWKSYRDRDDTDFYLVAHEVDEIIRTQKFEGAAAELLNQNIIARDLGLSDKQEHTGKDGGPMQFSDTERAARLASLLAGVKGRSDD